MSKKGPFHQSDTFLLLFQPCNTIYTTIDILLSICITVSPYKIHLK